MELEKQFISGSSNYWFAILVLLLAFSGCDNSLDPVDEERGGYSIYGYLDIMKDVNFIRIKNLNTSLQQDTTGEIDAKVVMENLENGLTETLNDTIVEFDGIKTHNFRTTMDLHPETKYRVSVERSDGRVTSATATAPPIAERELVPKEADCMTYFNLSFEPVLSEFDIIVDFGFHYNTETYWVRANEFLHKTENKAIISVTPFRILEDVFGVGIPPQNWQYNEGEIFCHELEDDIFEVRYTHYGPDLFGNSISDTLQIPGGAGRFGALYRDYFTFKIDTTRLCPPLPYEECI